MTTKIFVKPAIIVPMCYFFIFANTFAIADNIDPYDNDSQYAYAENTGWLNFDPAQGGGVQVTADTITGYVWSENIGWINLSPANYGGVINDRDGNLSGYAWGENIGWINFAPTGGGVTIDADGNFGGYAWGENIGWINFALTDNYVATCRVTFDDLANFAALWLQSGSNAADLDGQSDSVDLDDYSIFASYWQDFCPDGWKLK